MDRDELMRVTAKRYAEAQANVVQADRDASGAKTRADNARLERDRIEGELKGFVGRNIPRKLVMVGDAKAVLIQMDLRDESKIYVSVESAV